MAAEGSQMKLAREAAEKMTNSNAAQIESWPTVDGEPLVKISCAAAELIPTVQFGNAVVGPVQVTFFATKDGSTIFLEEGIAKAVSFGQRVCEAAVAEDRETIHLLTRAAAQGK